MNLPVTSSSRPTAARSFEPPRQRWAGLLAVGILGSAMAAAAWSSFHGVPRPVAPPLVAKAPTPAPAPLAAVPEPEAPAVLATSDKPVQEAAAPPAPRVQPAAAPAPRQSPTLVAVAPHAREIVESAAPASKPAPQPVVESEAPSADVPAAPASAPD
jgi:hypothetical protein